MKKFFSKCILTLGLALVISILMSFIGINSTTVQATIFENGKNQEYRLNLKSVTLVKGKTYTLKVYNLPEQAQVTFKSDDKEIASVNDDGVITANKVGVTVIKAIVKDGSTETELTCEVTVGPPAFSIKLTKSRLIIGLDKSDFLNVILKPANTVEVAKFSSKDSSIATVSAGGRITAKKLGLTYVFAEIDATDSTGAKRYDTCTVIVTLPEEVPLLENYFNEHPELEMIAKDELTGALDDFFNRHYPESSGTSLISSLNSYLDNKFNLAELRAAREALIAKYQNSLNETISNSKK